MLKIIPYLTGILVCSFLLKERVVKADLVETNAQGFGQNSLLVDSATGLGWLNLTESAGLSYQQIVADTQPGQIFSGFRLATVDEILTLFASAGITNSSPQPLSDAPVLSFISMIGATGTQYGHPLATGISATAAPLQDGNGHYVTTIDYLGGAHPAYVVFGQSTIYGDTYGDATVGGWLVEAVPEPNGYSFIGTGVIGILFLKFLCRY